MWDELRMIGLSAAARELCCDPGEVVQLLVAARGGLGDAPLQVSREELDRLRELGRMELPWWDGADLPEDPSPLRARVRAALARLLDAGLVGERQTRMDNLWRGLPRDERDALRDAVAALVQDEVLFARGAPIGILVSIDPRSVEAARELAEGGASPSTLRSVLEG